MVVFCAVQAESRFDMIFGFVIVLNLIVLWIETDYAMQTGCGKNLQFDPRLVAAGVVSCATNGATLAFWIIENIFLLLYTVEFVIRVRQNKVWAMQEMGQMEQFEKETKSFGHSLVRSSTKKQLDPHNNFAGKSRWFATMIKRWVENFMKLGWARQGWLRKGFFKFEKHFLEWRKNVFWKLHSIG